MGKKILKRLFLGGMNLELGKSPTQKIQETKRQERENGGGGGGGEERDGQTDRENMTTTRQTHQPCGNYTGRERSTFQLETKLQAPPSGPRTCPRY